MEISFIYFTNTCGFNKYVFFTTKTYKKHLEINHIETTWLVKKNDGSSQLVLFNNQGAQLFAAQMPTGGDGVVDRAHGALCRGTIRRWGQRLEELKFDEIFTGLWNNMEKSWRYFARKLKMG